MLHKKSTYKIAFRFLILCSVLYVGFVSVHKIQSFIFGKSEAYFDVCMIKKWTEAHCPCLPIEIEDKSMFAKLDLGFRGDISMISSELDQIKEKKFLGSQTMYNFRGDANDKKLFRIPKIRISNRLINDSCVQEATQSNENQTIFAQEGYQPVPASAKIGWKIFQNLNLLLDLKNEKIAFCDSLSTLQKQGYATEHFVQAPLIIERGLIEVIVDTNIGSLRCILDTGSTVNILNRDNEKNKSMEELLWSPENYLTVTTFQVNQQEFGPITFRQIPVQMPIHIDAILGMDFFSEHVVFLDFSHNLVYFVKM